MLSFETAPVANKKLATLGSLGSKAVKSDIAPAAEADINSPALVNRLDLVNILLALVNMFAAFSPPPIAILAGINKGKN